MSIQQRIASDIYRMADRAVTPEQIKSIQAHLVKGVQMGTVPSYVGVPLLSDLNQKMARIQTAPAQAQAMVQQPPIAQQVMGQAEQGVETLPSGLPEQGMAGGGIVAFAGGGMSDYEMASQLLNDEDDEDEDYVRAILGDVQSRESGEQEDGEGIDGLMATQTREAMSMQEGSQPPRGIQRERTSVTAPAGLESLLKMIEQKESGGRDYDKYGNLLTSSAGAQGRMQVMPGTSRDPGFGIRPAREGDVEDLARVGREYYTKMLDRYQDPKIAAIAYNWGPGNTDKWLSAGADMKRLPAETRNYVANMAKGGAVRFANTGLVDDDYTTIEGLEPSDLYEQAMKKARAIRSAKEDEVEEKTAPGLWPYNAPEAGKFTYGKQTKSDRQLALEAEQAATPATLPRAKPGITYAPNTGMGNVTPTRYVPKESNEPPSEYGRQMGNVAGFFGDVGKGVLGGIGTLGKHLVSAPGYGLSSQTREEAAKPAAGVATLPGAGSGRGRQGGPSLADIKRAEFEQKIAEAQDAEDAAAGQAQAAAAAPKEETKKETASKEEGGIRELLNKYRQDVQDQRDTDKYLSLLAAGLGMMGGTSPFAGANIGQGAMQGIKTYQQAAQQRSADERALLSGELGLRKYEQLGDIRKAALERQKLADAEAQQIKRARLVQGEQKMYADQLNEIRRLSQAQALAEYKGTLLPEQKDQIMASAETKLLQDPAYRALYQKVYGFEPTKIGGGTMNTERASKFQVVR